jgi:threonine synthase
MPLTRCVRCGAPLPLVARDPVCACGGLPAVPEFGAPGPLETAGFGPRSLWRWRAALEPALSSLERAPHELTLGEGPVPLERLALPGLGAGVHALRDDLQPTGSWKDRGSALLVAGLAAGGFADLVEDSSGNAGLSLAHYAKAAGLALTVYVPEAATALKKELIRGAGATLVEVPGPRDRATAAVRERVARGATYASHAAQALHPLGAGAAAFDITLALGRLPQAVVLPLGQGGYLAGLAQGFRALARAGHGPLPALVGVQSAACAPLAAAFAAHADDAERWSAPYAGLAEGVLCPVPGRARETLAAVRESGGAIPAVDDLALDRALRLLWREGFRVEPTSALPVAWLLGDGRRALGGVDDVVVILTGHGVRDGRPLVAGL